MFSKPRQYEPSRNCLPVNHDCRRKKVSYGITSFFFLRFHVRVRLRKATRWPCVTSSISAIISLRSTRKVLILLFTFSPTALATQRKTTPLISSLSHPRNYTSLSVHSSMCLPFRRQSCGLKAIFARVDERGECVTIVSLIDKIITYISTRDLGESFRIRKRSLRAKALL